MKPETAQSINFMVGCIASSSIYGAILDSCSSDAADRPIWGIEWLTSKSGAANLYGLSQKNESRHRSPISKGEKSPVIALVFLCPSKIKAGSVRLKFIMVGCIGQPQGWPAPLPGTANPIQSASHNFAVRRGGYQLSKGETVMVSHTQNPPKTQGSFHPRFDLFKLQDGAKMLICRGINLEQARSLLPESPAYRLKFAGSVKGGAI